MPPPPNGTNTLRVRVRGSAPIYNPESFEWKHILWCDVAFMPDRPIVIGQSVRLLEITGPSESPEDDEDDDGDDSPDDEDIGVEGKIIGVKSFEKETVELVVENNVERSTTAMIYLTVEYVPDRTVTLTGWNWIAYKLAEHFGRVTRRMPVLKERGGERED
ncbi:hypothetical protein C2E23DRAFT_859559 [Lenzites betulinus]|nr:hypothetical protein C2E23DRAFT_859559 [Lenzites betulinus]